MKIQTFVFSPFEVNTYVIYDQTGECVIIDPACYDNGEQTQLTEFISENHLKPVHLLFTHCHLDHVFGSAFVSNRYHLEPSAHKNEESNNTNAVHAARLYGINMEAPVALKSFIDEQNQIRYGQSVLNIFFIPGHTAGSLLFYNLLEKFVISGDVLFDGSIGRTDLPGGNFESLITGIREKLFSLPDDIVVYPGHGHTTTIGKERKSNPFFN
jgi:hydroxyacylglutathione hydrolase